MNAGDTFVPAQFDNHLWMILPDPSIDAEQIVIVNFTTHTVDEEPHCIVQKGEHPFVKHKTAVRYRDAKIVRSTDLAALIKTKQLTLSTPLAPRLLARIRDGAAKSDLLPEGMQANP